MLFCTEENALGQEPERRLDEGVHSGRQFGEAGLAQDIRLACQGLDKNDNDFVIGLVGKELFPLSALVQTMRVSRYNLADEIYATPLATLDQVLDKTVGMGVLRGTRETIPA